MRWEGEGGGLKSVKEEVGGGTFSREDRDILRDLETKGVSRETFDMEYLIAIYLSILDAQ